MKLITPKTIITLAAFVVFIVIVGGGIGLKRLRDSRQDLSLDTDDTNTSQELVTIISDYPESRILEYVFPELALGLIEILEIKKVDNNNIALVVRTNQNGIDNNKTFLIAKPIYIQPGGVVNPQEIDQYLQIGSRLNVRFFFYHEEWEEKIQSLCDSFPEVVFQDESSECLNYFASITANKNGVEILKSSITSDKNMSISDADYWINGIYVVE